MRIEQFVRARTPATPTSGWLVRVAWLICAAVVLLVLVGFVATWLNNRGDPRDPIGLLYVLACAFTGGLIVGRRPANVVGWLLLLSGLCLALGFAAVAYGLFDATRGGVLPLAPAVTWTAAIWTPLGTFLLVSALPLVFPDGQLPSRRWRHAARFTAVFIILAIAQNTLLRPTIQDRPSLPNPFVLSLSPLWNNVFQSVTLLGFFVVLGSSAASLIVRYRHSDVEGRLQIKWLTFAIVAWVVTVVMATIVDQNNTPLFLIVDTLVMVSLTMIPVSIGIAVLRYRLYDIDVLINRTLVYVSLTACVVGLYALVVVTLGALLQAHDNPIVSLAGAACAAIVFAPLRVRLERGVHRMLYGERAEPYTVLSRLGDRLENAIASDAVLPMIVQTVAETLKLPYAAIVLHNNGTTQIAAEAGTVGTAKGGNGTGQEQMLALPLSFQGEVLGELRVAPRGPNEVFGEMDRRLLRDLARQAGTAVHAVQLTAALASGIQEVRRSREQLVLAQEDERRRIQRDLHDGLGPVLASVRLRLEACLDEAQTSAPELVADLEQLDTLIGQASTEIRRLVYDLRPPVLDQLGLVPALRQHAARWSRETAIAVDMRAPDDLALPAAFEVTLFRVVHEALNNIYKHAEATRVEVVLAFVGDALVLRIEDNGVGGADEAPRLDSGTGIRGMRERAELLGGTLVIRSDHGLGTVLELYLPTRGNAYDQC